MRAKRFINDGAGTVKDAVIYSAKISYDTLVTLFEFETTAIEILQLLLDGHLNSISEKKRIAASFYHMSEAIDVANFADSLFSIKLDLKSHIQRMEQKLTSEALAGNALKFLLQHTKATVFKSFIGILTLN